MRHATLPPALAVHPTGNPPVGVASPVKVPVATAPVEKPLAAPDPMGPERSALPALLLACGNSLRQDDGVGLRIAEAAERLIPASRLRIVAAQQFTPEMAADLAATDLAIFVDASIADEPGAIRVIPVGARTGSPGFPVEPATGSFGARGPETHRLDPSALLEMAETLCGHKPALAFALTVGAGSFGYGDELTGRLRQAVPRAVRLVTSLVAAFTRPA